MTAPLLSDAALEQMRAIQNANMPSACALIAYAATRGPAATTPRTPVIVATVPCRLTVAGVGPLIIAAQPTPVADYVLIIPADTELAGVERAIVTGITFAGLAYTVEMKVTPEEPRSYSASRRLRASLASDTVTPTPTIGTVIVEEAAP